MKLTKKQKHQALLIRELMKMSGWQAYEEFIKDFVFEFLNSALSKETLNGLKMAVEEAKKLVIQYEKECNL